MTHADRLQTLWRIALLTWMFTGSGWANADDESAKPQPVRVLSYNIHHGEGTDGKLDLERIAGVIRSVEPDVVALQEVDRGVQRSEQVDQAAELARLTDMEFAFGGNIRYQGGDYGNAVLSRWPIKRHENHLLPSTGGEQRGALEVEIALPQAEESLWLLCTHLDHRRADDERLQSAQAINALDVTREKRAAILVGDLNDVHDSRTLREFEQHWKHTSDEVLPTIPSARPRRQIDFVLVRPAERWRVVETRVLDEPVASDHRPLLSVLELTDGD